MPDGSNVCPSKNLFYLYFLLVRSNSLVFIAMPTTNQIRTPETNIASDVSTEQLSKDVLSDSQSVALLADRGVSLEHIS